MTDLMRVIEEALTDNVLWVAAVGESWEDTRSIIVDALRPAVEQWMNTATLTTTATVAPLDEAAREVARDIGVVISAAEPLEERIADLEAEASWLDNVEAAKCRARLTELRAAANLPPLPLPPLSEAAERERFERWAQAEGYDIYKFDDRIYEDKILHDAFGAWLAAKRDERER